MNLKTKRLQNLITLAVVGLIVFVLLSGMLFTGIIDEYNGQLLTLAGIYVIIALSLNLITGFTGQLALGQAGFMAVGAYSTAIAVMKFGIPLAPAIIFGGLAASVFGLIIGFPTLRLRGDYLAIATLGFGEIIRVVMVNLGSLTGGAAGLKGIPPFADTGDFILDAVIKFAWVYVFVILTIAVVSNLINSSPGRAIISIREDEIASNSMGINVPYYKMFSFTVSSFLAGIGGGLYAIYFNYLNPAMFNWMNSMNFVVIVVLGGLGSITGTVIASVAFTYIQEWLRILGDFRLAVFGLALILVMLFWPSGLMGTNEVSIVGFSRRFLSGEYKPARIREAVRNYFGSRAAKKQESKKNRGVK